MSEEAFAIICVGSVIIGIVLVPFFLGQLVRIWQEKTRAKCAREGHDFSLSIACRVRTNAQFSRYVVEDYDCVIDKCLRCGELSIPKEKKYIQGFTSCTMPEDMWESMRKRGFVVMKRL